MHRFPPLSSPCPLSWPVLTVYVHCSSYQGLKNTKRLRSRCHTRLCTVTIHEEGAGLASLSLAGGQTLLRTGFLVSFWKDNVSPCHLKWLNHLHTVKWLNHLKWLSIHQALYDRLCGTLCWDLLSPDTVLRRTLQFWSLKIYHISNIVLCRNRCTYI